MSVWSDATDAIIDIASDTETVTITSQGGLVIGAVVDWPYTDADDLDVGGYAPTMTIKTSDATIAKGDTFLVRGVTYRVRDFEDDRHGAWIVRLQ